MARGDRQVSLTDIIRAGAGEPEVKSGVAALQSGAMFAPGFLDEVRAAAGQQPQGDIRQATAEALTSSAASTYTPVEDTPIAQDLSALMQGIASRNRQTTSAVQQARAAKKADLSAFGGIGPDVTGLEPFGGAGDFIQEDLKSLASKLATNELGAMGPDGAPEEIDGLDTTTTTTDGTTTTTTDGTTTTDTTDTTTTTDTTDTTDTTVDPFGGILKQAMDSVAEARGEKPKKDINDYKEEFALATGVDISGKPDKSQALMALGLSLMQNKAGRGFNVSNMLGAVGEAGEKAMPAFAKAKAEARNAQIAAGKFGLQKVAADKAAQAEKVAARQKVVDEILKSQLDSIEAERLENIKNSQARQLERLKTELKIFEEGAKPEEAREYEKSFDLTFAAGQGPATGWKIKMAYDKTMPDQAVLVNADPMIRKYIDGRAGINDALDLIDVMESSARDIAEGGGTAKFAYDKLNSAAKALFPELNTGKPTSEEEYTQALNMIMGRFKRFLTQETGNGISNKDVDIWEREIMKKPTWFQNFDSTSNALDLLRDTFIQKREEFDAGLDHLYDSANHRDQDVFGGLVEKYGTLEQAKGLDGKLIYKDGRLVRG